MADQEVSIKYNSDANDAIAANNALIQSLDQVAAKHASVKNSLGKGFGSARASGTSGSFDTQNRRARTPSAPSTPAAPPIQQIAPLPSMLGGLNLRVTGLDKVKQAEGAVKTLGQQMRDIPPLRMPLLPRTLPTLRMAEEGVVNLGKVIRDTQSPVANLNASVSTLGGSLMSIAGQAAAFTGLTIGVAALGEEIRKSIMAVADLDYAMSAVAAVGGLDKTSAEFQRLTGVVVEMGAKTRYTSTQAAEGLKELVAAGYKTVDATEILGDTLNLASTENMSLAGASEIVVAGMQAMGLGVDQSTRFVDVLARAANSSTASVTDMGESLKYVAPVASALGVSLEETGALIAILANNGIRGGMAGRGLSSVMSKLIAPTKDAQAALKAVGIRAEELNPQIVGVDAALRKLASVPQVELVKMFGVENLDVSNILAKNASGFKGMTDEMRRAEVTAKKMAETRMDNLTGDFDELGAAVDALRIKLAGGAFYDQIRAATQSFTEFLNSNREAIVENIQKVGSLALTLGKVILAYKAIKGASLIKDLVLSASKWATETALIKQNTSALAQNAAARGGTSGAGGTTVVGGGGGKGGVVGGMAGVAVGMAVTPDDAGPAESAAYAIGGFVVGNAVAQGIVKVGGPLIKAAMGAAVRAAAGSAIAGWVAAAGTGIAAVAAAFAAPLIVAAAVVAGAAVAWRVLSDAAESATAAVEGYANAAVISYRKSVQGAKDEVELAKAKNRIQQEINSIGQQIQQLNEDAGPGYEDQVKKLKEARTLLYSIYNHAEKINQRAQERIRLEQEIANHNQKAKDTEEQRARIAAQIAASIREQAAAAAEFNANYAERRDTAQSGMSESGQLQREGEKFDEGRKNVEAIRKNLEAAARSAVGVGTALQESILAGAAIDTRVKPSDTNAPSGTLMDAGLGFPESVAEKFKKPITLTFDKQGAITNVDEVSKYYDTMLKEAKESGNIKLQAEVEGYMTDLDKAVKASIEAGKKIEQALSARDAQVVSLLPTDRQEVITNNNFNDSIKAAQAARVQIDAILAEQGMEPLVDPKKEFKNAQDISDYYRRTSNAIKAAGRIDLLTKVPFADLTQSMNKNDAASKEQARLKAIQDQKIMTMKGIEMNEAKANNDPRREEQLRIEMELMKEQQSIMSAMNLSGKEGEAEAKKLAARKIGADLRVSLNENDTENNALGKMKNLGDGATAMNQLFGRASNSGMLENAKKQSEYLKQLVELAKIKESIKYIATVA